MNQDQQRSFERCTAIAERGQLRPFPCTRQDTGEGIWLVQSRTDPTRHYLLRVSGVTIQCPCPQAQYHGICAHAAAVHLVLQAKPQGAAIAYSSVSQPTAPEAPSSQHRSEPQREQECRQRAEAERRERALLWTDDRPFSMWK